MNRENAFRIALAASVLVLAAWATGPESISCGDSAAAGGPAAARVEDYEVIVYDRPGYGGGRESWTLGEGQRQRLVEFVGWDLNDRISSIEVGRRVGVALFFDRRFGGGARFYYRSVRALPADADGQFSALIIFHRTVGEPLGVLLGAGAATEESLYEGDFPAQSWFYPLPEDFDENHDSWDLLERCNDQPTWVYVLGGEEESVEAVLYEHADFRGDSISFPEYRRQWRQRRPRRADRLYDLGQYNFSNRVSSLTVTDLQSEYDQR